MPKKLDANTILNQFKTIHGDRYDYSRVQYKNIDTKVTIICPEHGEFLQTPFHHRKGHGCPKCANEYKSKKMMKSKSQFILDARKVHGDKYDYSKVDYKNVQKKIKIICPKHGIFEKTPNSHLRGRGCPECSHRLVKNNEDFCKYAKKAHGDKYDYSKVHYKNSNTKVTIICPEHGEFQQKPILHFQGRGCPKCANKLRQQTCFKKYGVSSVSQIHTQNTQNLTKEYIEENFLSEAGEIKMQEMIKHFNITATTCYRYMHDLKVNFAYKEKGFNPQEPGILYYIFDPVANLYKIGITNRSIEERFGKAFCSKRAIAILEQTYFENGHEALEAESEILEAFSYARTINKSWPEEVGGKTEFFSCDILNKHDA